MKFKLKKSSDVLCKSLENTARKQPVPQNKSVAKLERIRRVDECIARPKAAKQCAL